MVWFERMLARFAVWLCDLGDLTQDDVDRVKRREGILAPLEDGSERRQTVIRFGR